MKRMLVALTAIIAVALPLSVPAASVAKSKNIVQIAKSDPKDFSTLVSLVQKAGLVKALSGPTKLTLFAPTNAAFAKFAKDNPALYAKVAKSKALLTKVLEYHVVPGVVPAAKVVKLTSAKTLEGAKVHFKVKKGKVYVNNARVIKTDIHASNGIIHVINAVLTPPAS
jgi:uncharacterized surface protein with fasciclin (FAS1) repeats